MAQIPQADRPPTAQAWRRLGREAEQPAHVHEWRRLWGDTVWTCSSCGATREQLVFQGAGQAPRRAEIASGAARHRNRARSVTGRHRPVTAL